jgi:hypothetical protein
MEFDDATQRVAILCVFCLWYIYIAMDVNVWSKGIKIGGEERGKSMLNERGYNETKYVCSSMPRHCVCCQRPPNTS